MAKKAFWVSYDLGLKGDYSGLYTWLDNVGARECGDNLAFFSNEYRGDVLESIKIEIKKFATINNSDRIYLIYFDNKSKKMRGVFLFGGRQRAPWTGYAGGHEGGDEDFV